MPMKTVLFWTTSPCDWRSLMGIAEAFSSSPWEVILK